MQTEVLVQNPLPVTVPFSKPTETLQHQHHPKKEKDLSIETMRGIAILLVVSGYLVRSEIIASNHASLTASLLKFFYYSSGYIRMPLFTAISGYLYAASPATRASIKKLYLGKARRLLIPFFAISTLQYIVFSLLPLSPERPVLSDIPQIYLFPYHQFWFIYAVFLIFLFVGALDAFNALSTLRKWSYCLLASLLLNTTIDYMSTNIFSIPGVNYLLPYFLLGYGIRRYASHLHSSWMLKVLAGLFILSFGAQQYFHFAHISLNFHGHRILGALVAFSGLPLLFYFKRPIPIFAWLGGYAFCIHLFYLFGVGASHLVFHTVIKSTTLIFLVSLASALIFPIAVQHLLERTSLTRRLILGQRA